MAPNSTADLESYPSTSTINGSKLVNPLDPKIFPKLDPEFVHRYNRTTAKEVTTHQVSIDEVRNNPDRFRYSWLKDYSGHKGVKDWEILSKDGTSIKLRSYHPDADVFGDGPYGVHINYHGGGHMFGDLTSDAEWCMLVKRYVGIVVVDVDYRLCPENPFGKNIEDSWAALKWVSTHGADLNIDPTSISIGGISAGGLYTCILQHLARDNNPPIPLRLAMPVVPPIDDHRAFKRAEDSRFASFRDLALAPMLNWARISHFIKHMNCPEDIEPWLVSPLKAPNFRNLCKTFIITAECDPLCDEGEAYGAKLVAAGNTVTFRRYLGVPHPFMHMTELTQTQLYNCDTCAVLRVAHGVRGN